ncbi:DUF2244 domain-containing protein [Kordiimonas aquimaris]|uniref:DUF2244 domain-containing protein n=1 Tax=Kordiimonas aquimaris TaxID=707591 RepID=UPI0021D331EE|nr:DUF2244 domain-containing protein [Kordiimonas aquimaris]
MTGRQLAGAPLLLDLRLTPHRSLKRHHFEKLCLFLVVVCGLASIRFWIIGAWPVVLFLLFDIFAIWLAFTINYRRGQAFETVQLSETDLIIARSNPNGETATWHFEPYWAKVSLETIGGEDNSLSISLHDKTVTLGMFLPPAERCNIARKIEDALKRWKTRSF